MQSTSACRFRRFSRHETILTKRTLILALGFVLAACTNAAPAAGQAADTTTPSYRRDALRVEPGFWSGRLVRGARGEHAIHLMPWTDLTTIVAGVDSAVSYAARFESKQRWGGGLYLLGTLVAAVPVARNRGWDSLEDRDLVIFIGGETVALIGAMMMHSGAADLSRAVWWHNSQFAEP